MRAATVGLAVLTLGILCSGCLAVSSTQQGTWGKSAVVLDNEIYVVDLVKQTAHKVIVKRCHAADETTITVIQEQTESGS